VRRLDMGREGGGNVTDDLMHFDALGLGELIRNGEIRPSEMVELTIRRIEQLNPKLNAVIHRFYDQAREIAAGCDSRTSDGAHPQPFYGVPFLLKDLIAEYNGAPLNEGSRAVKGYISKLDSELVKRQKAAGLIVVGKTNTPEFGLLATTEPELYGPTFNPWDVSRTPGGSSGGSAAAVAAGIVPMAHGNDGGGSIRIPASCCGLFGLKPTRGRNPVGPLFGDLGSGLVHEHAVTRTVRDSAALLDATSGYQPGDPYWAPPKERPFLEEVGRELGRLKIGLLTSVPEGWHADPNVHLDCKNAALDAGRLCESLGHTVEEIDADVLSHSSLSDSFRLMFTCFAGHMVAYWEKELGKSLTREGLEPVTWATYRAGLKRTGADYLGALEDCQRFSRKIAEWYKKGEYDALLSPTLTIPPPKIESFQSTPENPMRPLSVTRDFVAFTFFCNLTGQPAMSVPLLWNDEGLPMGVQFAGRFGDEATLFRLAAQLEHARPWAKRIPPIHCSKMMR
jgi:amidase